MSEAFFVASKAAWVVLAPTNALTLCFLVGLALHLKAATRRVGRVVLATGAVAFMLVVALPVGEVTVRHLETRFPPLTRCEAGSEPAIAGIIVLGGALSSVEFDGQRHTRMGEAADRVRFAADLALARVDAPVLIAGGVTVPRPGVPSEASLIATLLQDLGVPAERLRLEGASRTTAENAAFASELSGRGDVPWVLVTSAYHMPRAAGAFEAAGLRVIAAPTDWQVDPDAPLVGWSASDRLRLLDLAAKEYLGLTAYWLTGRSRTWFPSRSNPACV